MDVYFFLISKIDLRMDYHHTRNRNFCNGQGVIQILTILTTNAEKS